MFHCAMPPAMLLPHLGCPIAPPGLYCRCERPRPEVTPFNGAKILLLFGICNYILTENVEKLTFLHYFGTIFANI